MLTSNISDMNGMEIKSDHKGGSSEGDKDKKVKKKIKIEPAIV